MGCEIGGVFLFRVTELGQDYGMMEAQAHEAVIG